MTLPQGYQDSLTGTALNAPLTLKAWDCRILSRHSNFFIHACSQEQAFLSAYQGVYYGEFKILSELLSPSLVRRQR